MGFRPVEKALFLTTSERARFTDLAVRFRIMRGVVDDDAVGEGAELDSQL